ncbi:MAG TPA: hypothetical protein VGD60_00195 [Candidatus Acidoferrales bacterium]
MTPEVAAGYDDEKPKQGDRVKLLGHHRYAGYTGKYIGDRENYENGASVPWVRLDDGRETPVMTPDWMKKL